MKYLFKWRSSDRYQSEINNFKENIMEIQLTFEQQQAIEYFNTHESLRLNAFAGTGKTTTLYFMAKSTNRTGIYLAFNTGIVADAEGKFPSNVWCKTIHGLAKNATPLAYTANRDKMFSTLKSHHIVTSLKLQPIEIMKGFLLQPRSLGFLIGKTIDTFLNSADRELDSRHIPLYGKLTAVPVKYLEYFRQQIVYWANEIWYKMIDPNDTTPLGYNGYLKMWALTDPKLPFDFVLLDEAQDSNSVVLDLLQKQNIQIVYVGDKYQQIYAWRGAVNAMEKIKTPLSSQLSYSFRFGPNIAAVANHFLTLLGERNLVKGDPRKTLIPNCFVQQYTVLCRTNFGVMGELFSAVQSGKRPHILGSLNDLTRLLKEVGRLKNGIYSNHPDFIGFSNWDEVIEFSESPEGEGLKSFVNMVKNYGDQELLKKLSLCHNDEKTADIIISTVHKAKGREWDFVQLGNDFPKPKQDENGFYQLNPEEVKLLYVAVTRARFGVDTSLKSVSQYFQIPYDKAICSFG